MAVLGTAERLFADHGYEGTSLEAIGQPAGVSRGTPGSFYGSKEALYRAVLASVLTPETELLIEAHAKAMVARGGPEEVLDAIVNAFVDVLIAQPSFVWLVER